MWQEENRVRIDST